MKTKVLNFNHPKGGFFKLTGFKPVKPEFIDVNPGLLDKFANPMLAAIDVPIPIPPNKLGLFIRLIAAGFEIFAGGSQSCGGSWFRSLLNRLSQLTFAKNCICQKLIQISGHKNHWDGFSITLCLVSFPRMLSSNGHWGHWWATRGRSNRARTPCCRAMWVIISYKFYNRNISQFNPRQGFHIKKKL